MSAIPFGLVGVLLGHYRPSVATMDCMAATVLSILGFFALSGIVVNNSIVLVTFYRFFALSGSFGSACRGRPRSRKRPAGACARCCSRASRPPPDLRRSSSKRRCKRSS